MERLQELLPMKGMLKIQLDGMRKREWMLRVSPITIKKVVKVSQLHMSKKEKKLDQQNQMNYLNNNKMEILEWLTNWYKSNCDGDWENSYGIKIDTLDNPGWLVNIDLTDTEEDGKEIFIKVENAEDDWYSIKSDGSVFEAYGDFTKLPLLLSKFKEFVEAPHLA